MIGTTIFRGPSQNITVTKHNGATPEVCDLIESMAWGSKGHQFYKIDNSVNPDFVALYQRRICRYVHHQPP